MNPYNGNLMAAAEFTKFKKQEPKKAKHFVRVERDLTQKETSDMQIKLYSPCACGSGKKLKFCCHKK